jgi:hypothetical protein
LRITKEMAYAAEITSAKIASGTMSLWQGKYKNDPHFRGVIDRIVADMKLVVNGQQQRAYFYVPSQSCINGKKCLRAKTGNCTFGPTIEVRPMDYLIAALLHGVTEYFFRGECFNDNHKKNGKCARPTCRSVGKGKANWLTQAQQAVDSIKPKNVRGDPAPFCFDNSEKIEVIVPKRGWGDQPIDVKEVEEKTETREEQPPNAEQIYLLELTRFFETEELLAVLKKTLPALQEASVKFLAKQKAAEEEAKVATKAAAVARKNKLLAELAEIEAAEEAAEAAEAAEAKEADEVP